MAKREEIAARALGLTAEDRAALAHALIQSLDSAAEDPDVLDRAWAAEILQRVELVRSGEAMLIPFEEVIGEARRRLD